MNKAFEAIKLTEETMSFLDVFQYQVDASGQLRLVMVSKDVHATPDVHPVEDKQHSHCELI